LSARRRAVAAAAWLLLSAATAASAAAQGRPTAAKDEYDDHFRKYSKRFFGVAWDWRLFKAQGMAESNLVPTAKSWVGARGIMQLMPATFKEIHTKNGELRTIDDPETNIAAGIMHDRYLWRILPDTMSDSERQRFMFGSYNAGQGTIRRARGHAKAEGLDPTRWQAIETVAPRVKRWRWRETVGYVRKIEANHGALTAPPDLTSTPAAKAPPRRADEKGIGARVLGRKPPG
jgi:membrane-bound lytic murein transglycosylase MltF